MTQKNHILITHLNLRWKIRLKMKDKKIIHFNFTKEITLKMNRPKKVKTCNFFVKGLSSSVKFEGRLLVRFQKNPT